MTSDEIRVFCDDYARMWERGDIAGLSACYLDTCEVVSPVFNILHGRAQLETSFRELFRAFTDFRFEIDDVIIDLERRERAVMLITAFQTHSGEIFGVPGTGRRFETRVAFVFTFDNGRIARDSRLYDFTGMLMQLGALRAKTA
jgi:steroid delta-isomerase-like uncharacterized protein